MGNGGSLWKKSWQGKCYENNLTSEMTEEKKNKTSLEYQFFVNKLKAIKR